MNPSSSLSQIKTLTKKELPQLSSSLNNMKIFKRLHNPKRVANCYSFGSSITAKQKLFKKSLPLYLTNTIAFLTIFNKIANAGDAPSNLLLEKNEQQNIPTIMQEGLYLPQDVSSMCSQFSSLSDCTAQHEMEKRKSAYMRFGRSSDSQDYSDNAYNNFEKRKSAYMRFGKRFLPYEESKLANNAIMSEPNKRKSAYMRFGKRKSAYMRFGKRSLNNLENENELVIPTNMEKRKSAYIRFGRR